VAAFMVDTAGVRAHEAAAQLAFIARAAPYLRDEGKPC
jgi:hypothetical protein